MIVTYPYVTPLIIQFDCLDLCIFYYTGQTPTINPNKILMSTDLTVPGLSDTSGLPGYRLIIGCIAQNGAARGDSG